MVRAGEIHMACNLSLILVMMVDMRAIIHRSNDRFCRAIKTKVKT